MQGGDRGLDLVGAGTAVAHGLVDQRQALGDQLAVPEPAILVLEQHDGAVGVEPGRRPRVLQQQQGDQAHDLGLGLKQAQQQAARRIASSHRGARICASPPVAE